ncbi:hypothetical protein [Actinoplanes sp. DH11]|uniref:hypothetical protein n=1 Tax=Actinoplanes sp. DH11 TaxID=2857011 RepID=UPI001E4B946F|nr:hypothetical protein [Actinoplanes sp. DH11]
MSTAVPDTLQRYVRTDQMPDARIFVAPSAEARFLCRRFGSLVAPAPGAETRWSRAVAMLVVAPFTQFTIFSFDLQAFLYEVFHQRLPAKAAHLLLMPAVNFFVLAALAQVWFGAHPTTHATVLAGPNLAGVYAMLLAVWYLVLAVHTRMIAWGLIMVAIVAGLYVAANVYYGHLFALDPQQRSFFTPTPTPVNPWLGALACAALIALSHAAERELPPRVTGSDRWLSLREFLGGRLPLRRRVLRLLMVAVQPVSGMLNEFVASPRLMPYGVLMRMLHLGYQPAVGALLRHHVMLAEASGNPALDYVGIGGGTRLNTAEMAPAGQAVP